MEEEKLYSGANGKLNFTITIGSKPMKNEKITFNATAGLQVISDIIQVRHIDNSQLWNMSMNLETWLLTSKPYEHITLMIFKVQVKSLTAGKTNKYETIMWKMALKRLPNVGLDNERLG